MLWQSGGVCQRRRCVQKQGDRWPLKKKTKSWQSCRFGQNCYIWLQISSSVRSLDARILLPRVLREWSGSILTWICARREWGCAKRTSIFFFWSKVQSLSYHSPHFAIWKQQAVEVMNNLRKGMNKVKSWSSRSRTLPWKGTRKSYILAPRAFNRTCFIAYPDVP